MRRDGTTKRATAAGWLVAGALAAALMTAVQANAQDESARDREDQALAYAQCMRENGYPEFPDPGPDGGLRIRVDGRSAPGFMAAQEACRDLAPRGLASDGADQERIEQLVNFAQCMRDSGVADFPDPDSQGQFNLRDLDVDIESATTRAAMDECRQAQGVFGRGGGGLMIRR